MVLVSPGLRVREAALTVKPGKLLVCVSETGAGVECPQIVGFSRSGDTAHRYGQRRLRTGGHIPKAPGWADQESHQDQPLWSNLSGRRPYPAVVPVCGRRPDRCPYLAVDINADLIIATDQSG